MRTSNFLKYLIGLVIVTAIPVVVYELWIRRSPEVVYVLSQALPSPDQAESRFLQHLVVRNNGDASAERIQVKLEGRITDFFIEANAADDQYTVTNSDNGIVVTYLLLPPTGEFSIAFETRFGGLLPDHIQIVHKDGVATDALSRERSEWVLWVLILVIAFYILLFALAMLSAWKTAVKWKLSEARHNPVEVILRRKPFYMSDRMWDEIVDYAVNVAENQSVFFMQLNETYVYQLLNSERPPHIVNTRWLEIMKSMDRALEMRGFMILAGSPRAVTAIALLTEKRPINSTSAQWDSFREAVVSYMALSGWSSRQYWGNRRADFQKLLECDIPESSRKILEDAIQAVEFYQMLDEVLVASGKVPEKALRDELSYTDKKIIEGLITMQWVRQNADIYRLERAKAVAAMECPDWVESRVFQSLKSVAEESVRLSEAGKIVQETLNGLKTIFDGQHDDELELSPTNPYLDRIERMRECVSEFKIANDSMTDREERVKQSESEMDRVLPLVKRQLDVIDRLLQDPSYIDKVEEYENLFARGNYQNLRRVANALWKKE